MKSFVLAATIAAANAYTESLADCETFAAQFSGTCGGTSEGNALAEYSTTATNPNWGTGVDINCSMNSSLEPKDPITVRCPNGGGEQTTCTVNRKNCVTCRQDNTQVYIRYQSNGMPNHCYGTEDVGATDAPYDQRIDFEVKWNRWMINQYNYRETETDEASEEQALLCNYNRLATSLMPYGQGYAVQGAAWPQEHVAGYAFTNVAIFNAIQSSSSVTDAVYASANSVDLCGTMSEATAGANDDNGNPTGRQLHYRSISECMKSYGPNSSTSVVPKMCTDTDQCKDYPWSWGYTPWTERTNYGGDVGLARDGHVIKGPYNEDGELWDCDDHDICNGAFLNDGSYAYVTTQHFPYTIGCWGPAYEQKHRLPTSCTLRTCGTDGAAQAGLTVLAGAFALLAVSLSV